MLKINNVVREIVTKNKINEVRQSKIIVVVHIMLRDKEINIVIVMDNKYISIDLINHHLANNIVKIHHKLHLELCLMLLNFKHHSLLINKLQQYQI